MVAGPTHRSAATLDGNLCLDTRCQWRVTPVLVRRLVQRLWDAPVWTA